VDGFLVSSDREVFKMKFRNLFRWVGFLVLLAGLSGVALAGDGKGNGNGNNGGNNGGNGNGNGGDNGNGKGGDNGNGGGNGNGVPEIDAGSIANALMVASGGVLILRGRLPRK
jgi:hypothetical protein